MRGTYLFSTKDISNETSAMSIILKLMSPKQKYDLTGINPNNSWDEVFHLSKKQPKIPIPISFFVGDDIPTWNEWHDEEIQMDHELFRIIENKFPWTIINNEYIKLVSKMLTSEDTNDTNLFVQFIGNHPNIYFKVIFDIEKFEEDFSIDSVGYILFDEKINQPVFFDINGIHILKQRFLEMICLGENMDRQ